jgi:hypothetical protein
MRVTVVVIQIPAVGGKPSRPGWALKFHPGRGVLEATDRIDSSTRLWYKARLLQGWPLVEKKTSFHSESKLNTVNLKMLSNYRLDFCIPSAVMAASSHMTLQFLSSIINTDIFDGTKVPWKSPVPLTPFRVVAS